MDLPRARKAFEAYLRQHEAESGVDLAESCPAERLSAGWAFNYQSRAYVESQAFEDLLVGQGPVVIADDGRLIAGGSLDYDAEDLLQNGPIVHRIRQSR
jgi:hypothetical protein